MAKHAMCWFKQIYLRVGYHGQIWIIKGLKSLGHSLNSGPILNQMLHISYREEHFCVMATSTSQSAACSSYLWGQFF